RVGEGPRQVGEGGGGINRDGQAVERDRQIVRPGVASRQGELQARRVRAQDRAGIGGGEEVALAVPVEPEDRPSVHEAGEIGREQLRRVQRGYIAAER